MTIAGPGERALRWAGRQIVRDSAERRRLEMHARETVVQMRYRWYRLRSGRAQRRTADRMLEEFWDRMHPRTLAGGSLIRVGGWGDGGYVMAPIDGPGTLVSIGVGDNNEADLWFAERGWRVVEWDSTITEPPRGHPCISFHAIGLGPNGDDRYLTLPDIIEACDPDGPAILMIDIEGDEWLPDIGLDEDTLDRFDQVVIELHGLHRIAEPEHRERVMAVLRALTTRHEVIHVHANNCSPQYRVRGLPLPEVLEVSLLARHLVSDTRIRHDLPMELDRPNDPDRSDHVLTLSRIAAR